MNHLPDNERLLRDVLAEESAGGFRETLLAETLRQARGRRRRRQVQRIGGGLAVVLAATFLLWRRPSPPAGLPVTAPSESPGYQLVRSQPLASGMVVTTQPLAAERLVISTDNVAVVWTVPGSTGVREIGDKELLALAPEPAALVRRGTHEAELIFINATDDEPPQ